jgi:hypothetical protein
VLEDLSELEEFAGPPWNTNHVSGRIVFGSLQQTAGRRALLRDRLAFPLFVNATKSIEPLVTQTVERVRRQVDAETADRMSDAIRRIFDKVLKELADLDNPLRSATGSEPGEGALFEPLSPPGPNGNGRRGEPQEPQSSLPELVLPPLADPVTPDPPPAAKPANAAGSKLPTLAPDPSPGEARSRFDPDSRVVFFNESHPDYLLVKDGESALLDYLVTLVAKELVVFNNPRAAPEEIGEELVRMLVRVRRHLPKRFA